MKCHDQDKKHKLCTDDCMSKCERTGSSIGKWTAGPWKVISTEIYCEVGVVNGGNDHTIADTQTNENIGIDREQEIANAHLIAAAPELYDLLKEARSTLEMCKDVAPAVSLCADIDKALAKARGESDD